MAITQNESWAKRNGEVTVHVPLFFRRLLEQITVEARQNRDYIDQSSGVSVRLSISAMENFISNIERRTLLNAEKVAYPRIVDLQYVIPAITGKLELVYEGEQEGSMRVAEAIISLAVKHLFSAHFPPVDRLEKKEKPADPNPYAEIIQFFDTGNQVSIQAESDFEDYYHSLIQVPGLETLAGEYFPMEEKGNVQELAAGMEFVLEGLHAYSRLSKVKHQGVTEYRDMISTMMDGAVET
jgi:magnesium chelatase subunit I